MADDIPAGVISWVIYTIGASVVAIMAFLMNRTVSRLDSDMAAHKDRLDDHDKQHNNCSLELANFKTEVANNYAKDASVQQSLARIHERIDTVNNSMDKGFGELRDDIKKLIGMVK